MDITKKIKSQPHQIARVSELTALVRKGGCGTDPRIVPEFVRLKAQVAQDLVRQDQWQSQVDIIEVLFETIADTMLARCWRSWCSQCCCMPLHTLRCLSSTAAEQQIASKLEAESAALRDYFL